MSVILNDIKTLTSNILKTLKYLTVAINLALLRFPE